VRGRSGWREEPPPVSSECTAASSNLSLEREREREREREEREGGVDLYDMLAPKFIDAAGSNSLHAVYG
jgi:hypothetical protein